MFKKQDSIKLALLSPNFISYWNDIFLIVPFIKRKISVRLFSVILVFSLFVIIKYLLHTDLNYARHILPMLRTFLVLEIVIYLSYFRKNLLEKLFWAAVLLNFMIFIIGEFSPELYRLINDFFNGSQRFVSSGSTIASVTINERNSALFTQPSNAGLFLVIVFIIILNSHFNYMKALIPILIVWGVATKSSVFIIGLPIVLILYMVPRHIYKTPKFIFSVLLLPMCAIASIVILFKSNPDMFLLYFIGGGRFVSESNFMQILINMTLYEFIIGIDLDLLTKGLGDSSVVTKIFLGGVLLYGIYLVFLYIYLRKVYYLASNKKIFYNIIIILSISEIGFNSFSQPGIYNAIYLAFFLVKKNES